MTTDHLIPPLGEPPRPKPLDNARGLYGKYRVERVDGDPHAKHAGCEYFVLDPRHDAAARDALRRYADSAGSAGNKTLRDDLTAWCDSEDERARAIWNVASHVVATDTVLDTPTVRRLDYEGVSAADWADIATAAAEIRARRLPHHDNLDRAFTTLGITPKEA